MSRRPAYRIGGELVDDEKVSLSDRKQLAELLGKWLTQLQNDVDGLTKGVASLSSANFKFYVEPLATGSPTVFLLPETPYPADSIQLFVAFSAGTGYLALKLDEHYTVSGNVLTYDATPPSGLKHFYHCMVA